MWEWVKTKCEMLNREHRELKGARGVGREGK